MAPRLGAASRAAAALLFAAAAQRAAATYSAGSLLLVRVADAAAPGCPGPDPVCSRAAPLFLDEYVPSADGGSATLASSVPIPGVTLSATDHLQGSLNLCADATCVLMAGVAAPAGAAPTAAAPYFGAADRVVVRVAADGTVDTSTRISPILYGGLIKGVCSFNGSGYFVVGNSTSSCVSYAPHGLASGSAPVDVAKGAGCAATSQGAMEGAYTACTASAKSAPGAGNASTSHLLLLARNYNGYGLVDVASSAEATWTQAGKMTLSQASTDVVDGGFSNGEYYGQIVASRNQNLFFLTDPHGGSCEIDICRGAGSFPTLPLSTGTAGCGVHVSYAFYCGYSGVSFSLDESLIYFTAHNRLISYPAAGGAGKVLVTLPAGQEFRGVSRAPFVCGGGGGGGGSSGNGTVAPAGSPLAGWFCPNGAGSPPLPCPAGSYSAVGATTACALPPPTVSPTPSPSPTRSVSASPSTVPPNQPCFVGSTFVGPDWVTPNIPTGIAYNAKSKAMFVADAHMHEILIVAAGSATGQAAVFAGSSGERGFADGQGTNARFCAPLGLDQDDVTGDVYVADSFFALIRKISPTGLVTTVAGAAVSPGGGGVVVDGPRTAARFSLPSTVTLDSASGVLYVVDGGGAYVRVVRNLHNPDQLVVATLAGTGVAGFVNSAVGTSARISMGTLGGLALDAGRGLLFLGDFNNNAIRLLNLSSSAVTTIAGGKVGPPLDNFGTSATFWLPAGLHLSLDGTVLYVAEWQNGVIRSVNLATLATRVVAGDTDLSGGVLQGVGALAKLPWPTHMDMDPTSGALFVTHYFHASIVQVDPKSQGVVLFVAAGGTPRDGTGLNARFTDISAVAVDSGDNLIVVDRGAGQVRRVTPAGVTSTLAGRTGPAAFADGPGTTARFSSPTGVAVFGGAVYVSDSGNRRIRAISGAGVVSTLAGSGASGVADGAATQATFTLPGQMAALGGSLFVLDAVNFRWKPNGIPLRQGDVLRQVSIATGAVSSLASSSGATYFNFGGALSPIVADTVNNALIFADFWNSRLMRWTPAAGVAYMTAIGLPQGLAIDSSGGSPFPNSVLATGSSGWQITNINRVSNANLGPAFGGFNLGSSDGIFLEGFINTSAWLSNTGLGGVVGILPGPMAFDSRGTTYLVNSYHSKIMVVGKLAGAACNLALDPNSAAHACAPGTYISWAAQTCLPCSSAASRFVFPFSSYCQDASGNVIAPDAGANVGVIAGISIAGAVAGVAVIVGLLAARAYYVINAKPRLARRPSAARARRIGGAGDEEAVSGAGGGGPDAAARAAATKRLASLRGGSGGGGGSGKRAGFEPVAAV